MRHTSHKRAAVDEWRDAVIYVAVKKGLKGEDYCQFMRENGAKARQEWWWSGGPREYPDFYKFKKWKLLIYKEKSRTTARLQRLAKTDPGELKRILSLLDRSPRSPKSPRETKA
jgi:hypothetical protein